MFLPGRDANRERVEKQQILNRVERWAEELVPEVLREGCTVSVQEVVCGDPKCAPIDTLVTLFFQSGGQGMFGLPMEVKDVTKEELQHSFPTEDVLEKWHRGEEAEWPPNEDPGLDLRFNEGMFVLCRVGPTDWAPGKVEQLWYREVNWPPNSYAPYKILLDDGRYIYAPADVDQVIKLDTSKEQPPMPGIAAGEWWG